MTQPHLDFRQQAAPARDLWLRCATDSAHHYMVPVSAVLGRSRLRTATLARHHAWFRLRDEYGRSWVEIARTVGCDHCSVMHGAKRFAKQAGLINWKG